MKKDVYEYFLELDTKNLPRINNVIIKSPQNFSKVPDDCYKIFKLFDKRYFSKVVGDVEENFQPMASSELFNEAGVLSPPIYILKENDYFDLYSQITEDVHLPIFDKCLNPCEIGYYDKLLSTKKLRTSKWEVLYNKLYRDYFLTFMTPECLDEIINTFLIDELRTEGDRHMKNYFLYQLNGSNKFNGVVVIDHDLINLFETDCLSKHAFKDFIKHKACSNSPTLNCVHTTHENAIKAIRQLLDDGVLGDNNITALKDALSFDLPGRIKEYGEKFNIKKHPLNRVYTPLSYLWDYNRTQLGKDLEI